MKINDKSYSIILLQDQSQSLSNSYSIILLSDKQKKNNGAPITTSEFLPIMFQLSLMIKNQILVSFWQFPAIV